MSISSIYYKKTKEEYDKDLKNQIESVLVEMPYYGHRRIARELKMGKNKILRVMHRFGIKPRRRSHRKFIKKEDIGRPTSSFTNLISGKCPIRPSIVWISDFTYIKYKGRYIYLATIIDSYTKEVLGFSISRFHNKYLVLEALNKALSKYEKPLIIHSDQGSEYMSQTYSDRLKEVEIQISVSDKGSPWQNGSQESFFGRFKVEFGDFDRFEDIGELIGAIYQHIWEYNNKRIHTSIKDKPNSFRQNYLKRKRISLQKKST